MEDILALAMKQSEAAEVFSVSSEETSVAFETNRLKKLDTRQATTLSLRIIRDGRIGLASSSGQTDPARLVKNAVETAQFGMAARFEMPASAEYPKVDVYDNAVESVATRDMIDLGEEMIAIVTGHTPGIICGAGVTRQAATHRIINSRGGKAEYRKSYFGLGVEGTLINGTDMLFVGESDSSCRPLSNSKAIAAVVVRQLELARQIAAVPTRSLPVIFTPDGVASALVMPLMAAFNGKTVLEGASPIGGKLGQTVFDEKLSLHDDPTIAYRPASRPCDDESVPSQRTALIEAGKVAGFLYDLQTAARAGTRSTGSARRNGGPPSPSVSAFTIASGKVTFDEMVRDIKEGLVIEQLLGAEQGNILGGDFSGNVLLGYKVENGKTVGRVKNTMVSGNVYHLLKQISAIGSESKWVGGFLYTPPLYFPALSVASKG